jgi:hypothetical protein
MHNSDLVETRVSGNLGRTDIQPCHAYVVVIDWYVESCTIAVFVQIRAHPSFA